LQNGLRLDMGCAPTRRPRAAGDLSPQERGEVFAGLSH
jgi:hypothetical protein